MVVAAGLGALVVASIYVKIEGKGILGIIFTLYAIFSGGIAGMFLLGLFSKRANKQGLYIGIAACVLFTGYAILTSTTIGSGEDQRLMLDFGSWNFTHHKYMLGVYSHFVLFGVGYLASFFFKTPPPEENLTWVGWRKIQKGIKEAAGA
jgi:SSS family solute:Na+ symporter